MSNKGNFIHIIRTRCNVQPEMVFEGNLTVTGLNPYSYKIGRKHLDIFEEIDVIYMDGIALTVLFNLLGIKTKRLSFDMTALGRMLFEHANATNKSIYFIGSKQEQVSESVANFGRSFPKMRILGHRHGYFSSETERDEVLNNIVKMQPNYVVAGLGTPLQEKFLIDLKAKGFRGTSFTCGGFLHQSTQAIDYYPKWINKLHLRAFYRLYDEPKLFKRYFVEYPKSFALFFYDYFR